MPAWGFSSLNSSVNLNYFHLFITLASGVEPLFPFLPLPVSLSSLAKVSLLLDTTYQMYSPHIPMKMAKKRVATLSNKWEYCKRTGRKRSVCQGRFQGEEKGQVAEADLRGLAGGVQSPVFTVPVTQWAHDDLSSN